MDCRGSYFEDGILVFLFLFPVEVKVLFLHSGSNFFFGIVKLSVCDRR